MKIVDPVREGGEIVREGPAAVDHMIDPSYNYESTSADYYQNRVLKAIIEVMMETQQERIAQKLGFEVVR